MCAENATGATNHKCDLSPLGVEGSLVLMLVFNCLLYSVKLAVGRTTGLLSFITIKKKMQNSKKGISVICRYFRPLMEFYGLQGGFRDSMLRCSNGVDTHCFLLCCVSFP